MTRSVRTEYGTAGIIRIRVAVVANGGDYLVVIVTRRVTLERALQPSLSARILNHLTLIVAHGGYRCRTGDNGAVLCGFGRIEVAVHTLNIGHRSSDALNGHLERELKYRLEDNALCRAQTITDCAVGCLTEISALGMLGVSLARCKNDLHIGYRRTRENTKMGFLGQMCKDKTLPVFVEAVLAALAANCNSAVAFCRLHDEVNLGVMAQRLKMSYSLNRVGDSFLINYISFIEIYLKTESVIYYSFEDLELNLTHQTELDFTELLVPDDV